PRLTSLRMPADPARAAQAFCGGGTTDGTAPDAPAGSVSAAQPPGTRPPHLPPSVCIDLTLALADLSDPAPGPTLEQSASLLKDHLPDELRGDVDAALQAGGTDEERLRTSLARITSWVNGSCSG
ncbi:MAG: hypothetical protein R2726_21680, partial [Acidimicrobiales bacterium]